MEKKYEANSFVIACKLFFSFYCSFQRAKRQMKWNNQNRFGNELRNLKGKNIECNFDEDLTKSIDGVSDSQAHRHTVRHYVTSRVALSHPKTLPLLWRIQILIIDFAFIPTANLILNRLRRGVDEYSINKTITAVGINAPHQIKYSLKTSLLILFWSFGLVSIEMLSDFLLSIPSEMAVNKSISINFSLNARLIRVHFNWLTDN